MRVLITGGLRGIGRALALQMHAAGHHVIINDNGCQEDGIQIAHGEMPPFVPNIHTYQVNLTTMGGCLQLAHAVAYNRASLHALVHCAAVRKGSIWGMMDVNCNGTIFLTELLLPTLLENQGVVMFFSSGAVDELAFDTRWYAASKAAVETYALSIADRVTTFIVRPSARTRMNPQAETSPEDIAATCQGLLGQRSPQYLGRVLSLPGQGRVEVVR